MSVTSLAARSVTIVETIASPPTSSGSSAATRLRKKSSESRKRRGNAYSSAFCRSLSTWLLACAWLRAPPPTVTPGSSSNVPAIRSAASCASLSSVGFMLAAM